MRHLTIVAAALAFSTATRRSSPPRRNGRRSPRPSRPATGRPDNVKLDASRKPAQVLQFLGLKPGMHVLDLFGANAYWAEIMAPGVGPKGHVHGVGADAILRDETKARSTPSPRSTRTSRSSSRRSKRPTLPTNFADFVMLNLNYHDTYWQSEKYRHPADGPERVPQDGLCVDEAGRGDRRHRPCRQSERRHPRDGREISPDRSEGGEGRFQARRLRARRRAATCCATRPTITACWCSIPKIRGKTDRFVFKFRKPR